MKICSVCLLVSNFTYHLNDVQISIRTSYCGFSVSIKLYLFQLLASLQLNSIRRAAGQILLLSPEFFLQLQINQHSIRNFLYVLNFHNILAKKSNQFKIFIILQKKAINFKFSLYSCRKKQSNTISAPKILSGEFHGIYDRNISITL